MAFEKEMPRWDAKGTEPPESKKITGWDAGDKPPADYFNWFFNGSYEAVKELQEKAVDKSDFEIPDDSVTDAKLSDSPGQIKQRFASHLADNVRHRTQAEKDKLEGIETGAQVNRVNSVAGKTGNVLLAKGDVGLGNVDNLSATAIRNDSARQFRAEVVNSVGSQTPTEARIVFARDEKKLKVGDGSAWV